MAVSRRASRKYCRKVSLGFEVKVALETLISAQQGTDVARGPGKDSVGALARREGAEQGCTKHSIHSIVVEGPLRVHVGHGGVGLRRTEFV